MWELSHLTNFRMLICRTKAQSMQAHDNDTMQQPLNKCRLPLGLLIPLPLPLPLPLPPLPWTLLVPLRLPLLPWTLLVPLPLPLLPWTLLVPLPLPPLPWTLLVPLPLPLLPWTLLVPPPLPLPLPLLPVPAHALQAATTAKDMRLLHDTRSRPIGSHEAASALPAPFAATSIHWLPPPQT